VARVHRHVLRPDGVVATGVVELLEEPDVLDALGLRGVDLGAVRDDLKDLGASLGAVLDDNCLDVVGVQGCGDFLDRGLGSEACVVDFSCIAHRDKATSIARDPFPIVSSPANE
jgi:hypothetical protein